ncbi:MAG: hypothetical protein J6X02_02920, partial [Bacilli bacterium]|nr:hypothetical protein [Bacilli bacterium]
KELGINDAVKTSIKLMDIISKLQIDNRDIEEVVNKCLPTLYNVIVMEQAYNRSDIISLLNNKKEYQQVKELIVKYVFRDLASMEKDGLTDIKISNIDDGDSDKYVNSKVIDQIVDAKYALEKEEYNLRRTKKLQELQSEANDYEYKYRDLEYQWEENTFAMAGIRISKIFNISKLCSFIIVPSLLIYGGITLGRNWSDNIDEYRTITRVVDPVSNEVVNTLSDTYDENEYSYASTLKLYEPWEKHPSSGYTRKVIAYVTDDENKSTGTIKYIYNEVKDQLDENDNTDESTTLITETIQDKNDSRKSKKYVVVVPVLAGVLALGIEFLLGKFMGISPIFEKLSKLSEDLKSKKNSIKRIEESVKTTTQSIKELNNQCKTYGEIYQFDRSMFKDYKIIKKTLLRK